MTISERLKAWALKEPDRIFLREREGRNWSTATFEQVWRRVGTIAAHLVRTGCSQDAPLLVLAGNSIDHALATLAAYRVGIPVAPVSPSYAAYGNYDRLRALAQVAGARAAVVGPEICAEARDALAGWGVKVFTPASLEHFAPDDALVAQYETAVSLDTAAKLMFTSGSTGTPKAVINTHRMMATNQLQLSQIWPLAPDHPPVLVDWLPWSHTFGGNFVFNMALWHGGSLTIDEGRPAPALIGKTLEAMAEFAPTRFFGVPATYEALIPAIEANPELSARAFRNVQFAFCAAAALPEKARDRMIELMRQVTGQRIPMLAGWGSTETAPCVTAVHFPASHSANIGVPLPGVTIKLTPEGEKLELRVKGPNVMPGYWRAPEATASAFDSEGYYCIGDAGRFIDPDLPEAGLAFDGRVAENFKLTSGTWVNVGALRIALIDATRPYVQDAVIAGHDRDEIGVLLFLNESASREAQGLAPDDDLWSAPGVIAAVREAISAYNQAAGGSSQRIARFRIERSSPSPALGEITDKGYINQRGTLRARSAAVAALFADEHHKVDR
ncbi:AMP-binding protein [Aquisediminimonas profunda]|uniref:AMP-binding protein n=1 Tax=Aquisediminimonas profunda TaxID=1550733 RepID=UPI001C626694|nr:AMP-binding protein [Aquisediminimonas profunda]